MRMLRRSTKTIPARWGSFHVASSVAASSLSRRNTRLNFTHCHKNIKMKKYATAMRTCFIMNSGDLRRPYPWERTSSPPSNVQLVCLDSSSRLFRLLRCHFINILSFINLFYPRFCADFSANKVFQHVLQSRYRRCHF
jgi:hypothetical protein